VSTWLLATGWLVAVTLAVIARRALTTRAEAVADACHELRGGKGLYHVIVGAAPEAGDAVGLLSTGGEENHGRPELVQMPVCPGLLDAAHHLKPIEAWKHYVQHNKIGVPGLDCGHRIGSCECLTGLISCALQIA